jgi:hypothetical protein
VSEKERVIKRGRENKKERWREERTSGKERGRVGERERETER